MYLSLALGVATLVMAYLGYHYSVPREVSPKKRWLLRIAFVGLSAVSLVLIGIQGRRADQSEKEAKLAQQEAKVSQDRLNATMDRLGTQTDEIKRVEGLNTNLQNRLLNQSEQLLNSSQTISKLSEESLRNITGAGSIPCVIPQTGNGIDPIPLMIWNSGKHILTGVTVTIRKPVDYHVAKDYFNRPQMEAGTVNPGFGKLLSQGISPSLNGGDMDVYAIEISTQSDLFGETLQFRRNRQYPGFWAFRFFVSRVTLKMGKAPVVFRSRWSDEDGLKAKK